MTPGRMPRLARMPDRETTVRFWLVHASFCLLLGWAGPGSDGRDVTPWEALTQSAGAQKPVQLGRVSKARPPFVPWSLVLGPSLVLGLCGPRTWDQGRTRD